MNFISLKVVATNFILVCNIASVRGVCGPNEVEIWVYNSFWRFNEAKCVLIAKCSPNGVPTDLKCALGVCECSQPYCSSNVFAIGYPDQVYMCCGECVYENRPLYYGLVSATYNWPVRSITCRECDSVNEFRTMVANQWVCQGIACRNCPTCRKEQCNNCGANLPPSFYQENLVKFGFEHTDLRHMQRGRHMPRFARHAREAAAAGSMHLRHVQGAVPGTQRGGLAWPGWATRQLRWPFPARWRRLRQPSPAGRVWRLGIYGLR